MKRMIAVIVSFAAVCWLSLAGAYNLTCLLTAQKDLLGVNLPTMLAALENPDTMKFFLLLIACGVLLIVAALVSRASINYKSRMREVVPDLSIPQAEGQGQYGTAKFLDSAKYGEVWSSVKVSDADPTLRHLMRESEEEAHDESTKSARGRGWRPDHRHE